MFKPNSIILYVIDVEKSTRFYTRLLNAEPVEQYSEFSVFALSDDMILGLQAKSGIDPAPQPHIGGMEICMSDISNREVDEIFRKWSELGVEIIMKPAMLDFGYTFVATDPDGHRLRVCATDTTNID
ncbi:TPA: VOC family protein [Morganella morganii]|uniref:VOC family protein n=1 Tax=Morganella morganii TaxID=582 RepID=UPI00041303CB|nr:VOC family protein [Morganella morganii]EKW3934757.1 VOC family protein [Morganella morganii]EKW3939461.1 VOC family protein [Morganella morganii]MBT0460820.1 VOC family protein [Morganella morganii subsp. morganii]QQU40104.1 VOC family protein [Morganella morganii]QSA15325.1 VOC family protein [Morganella morganii]